MLDDTFHTIPAGEYIFRPTGESSLWTCVNSEPLQGFILSSFLNLLNISIDDDAQFCRIIRYFEKIKTTVVYRNYSGNKITISITHVKFI